MGDGDIIWLENLAVWHHSVAKPRARVLLVHGISEHSGRHQNTIQFFLSQNVEVIRFDMRGAGRSGGKRQWCETFHDYVIDTETVYHWICREFPALPLFVMGHSLGGAIAIHFAAEHGREIDGLILTAPAYKTGRGISPGVIFVGTWINRVMPNIRLPKPLDLEAISRKPEVVKAYADDPLVCHANTVHQGVEVLKGLQRNLEKAADIQCPTMIVHGTSDRVIQPDGSYEILRALGCAEKELHFLPNGFHEPHNDLEAENFYRHLQNWLARRIQSPKDLKESGHKAERRAQGRSRKK